MTVMISFHKIKIQIEFIEVQIIFQSIWIESIFFDSSIGGYIEIEARTP